MSRECSKSITRRLADANFATRYFVGRGLDIGGKPDPLALYLELFPRATSIRTWDWEDGDAQLLASEADGSYDFVHSSHCLEHLVDPRAGLANWFRVVRPGGHLVILVPDEDLYEQGVFPSTYNRDHKHTFTIWKAASWSAASINLFDLLATLGPAAEVLKLELLHGGHRFALPRYDQTLSPVAASAIEFVLRKRMPAEVEARGRLPSNEQPPAELRVHLNQYRDDRATVVAANPGKPPFKNDEPL
jgi:SAM-dependent methyltransferase